MDTPQPTKEPEGYALAAKLLTESTERRVEAGAGSSSSEWVAEGEAAREHLLKMEMIMERTGDYTSEGKLSDAYYALVELIKAEPRHSATGGTQRPGTPDGSLATETRKPGSLK